MTYDSRTVNTRCTVLSGYARSQGPYGLLVSHSYTVQDNYNETTRQRNLDQQNNFLHASATCKGGHIHPQNGTYILYKFPGKPKNRPSGPFRKTNLYSKKQLVTQLLILQLLPQPG